MKRMIAVIMVALLAAMVCQPAQAEWQPDMNAPVAEDIPADVTNAGGSQIEIQSVEEGGRFQVTLYDVKVTPKGGGDLSDAEVVRVASGILDAAKVSGNRNVTSEYVAEGKPIGGEMVFNIANYSKTAGVPVVEHLWGVGKSAGDNGVKYLILNPESPWVVYEGGNQPDLETLTIGILMCPGGQAVPLKSLGNGKIKQGKHPELADACK